MRTKSHVTMPAALSVDRDGAVALEFALIFPIMLTLFLGSFEIANLLMASLKTTAATEATADLVAQTRSQQPNIAVADVDSFYYAAGLIMTPYAKTGLQLAFAGVTYDASNNPQVLWHHEENGAAAITTAQLNITAEKTLLKGLGSGVDSLVMVQAKYTYTSPVSFVLGKTYTFTDTAYNRPRYVPTVTCTTC
jgi:Flp pilus assembly protein TadG